MSAAAASCSGSRHFPSLGLYRWRPGYSTLSAPEYRSCVSNHLFNNSWTFWNMSYTWAREYKNDSTLDPSNYFNQRNGIRWSQDNKQRDTQYFILAIITVLMDHSSYRRKLHRVGIQPEWTLVHYSRHHAHTQSYIFKESGLGVQNKF